MPIGKNSISRVAEGLDSANAAPLAAEMPVAETPATEVEKKIVEATSEAPLAPEKGETVATTVEKKTVKSTAKKAPAKKPAAKKTEKKAEKKVEDKPAEEKKAPELIGQAVAAPKKRGRKPGTKNKPKAATAAVKAPRAVAKKPAVSAIAIGEELPVYLL